MSSPVGIRKIEDDGCRFWNKCETCPYPDCIDGIGIRVDVLKRKAKAKELANKGYKIRQIAKELGVCTRTVRRHLKGAKLETNN